MLKIVVLASGNGSNFQSLIDAGIKISKLIVNRNCYAIERAKLANIDFEIIENLSSKNLDDDVDLIVLLGYLKIIPIDIIKKFSNKIINIHPSLLPKFGGKGMYGLNVHKAVIEAKEKESGATVHFVNEIIDGGSIIKQVKVDVYETDSPEDLQKRILVKEHELIVDVVKNWR